MNENELYICHACIDDEYLSNKIQQVGVRNNCTYCKTDNSAIALSKLSKRVEKIFEEYFDRTSSEPDGLEYMAIKHGNYDWERSGDPVNHHIQEIVGVDDRIADDIQGLLDDQLSLDEQAMGEEEPFGNEAYYKERNTDGYQGLWKNFVADLKTRSRFFSQSAQETLAEIFNKLPSLQTRDGNHVVSKITPTDQDRFLYRARLAFSQNEVDTILSNPEAELGAPPYEKAKSGRMNPVGISVFYGARDEETCVSELRPPVGSFVIVAKFEFIRAVNLLDIDKLIDLEVRGSYFDPGFRSQLDQAAFLRNFHDLISLPVMPDDEDLGYLPTQVVSEYLSEMIEPQLDGIIYHSTQNKKNGRNIVFFHHSAGLEPSNSPHATKTRVVRTYGNPDDPYEEIHLKEHTIELPKGETSSPLLFVEDILEEIRYSNKRTPTLRLDLSSIKLHSIQSAKYPRSTQNIRTFTINPENEDF